MTTDAHRLRPTDLPDINGLVLLEAIRAATDWLAVHRASINALNVFPVPDGDTGTNMLLTLREAVTAGTAAAQDDTGAGPVAAAIARGAFIGARGNSGVILCQMIEGFARAVAGKPTINGRDLAKALVSARELAYRAVLDPVEGTMLTVIRVAASAAQAEVDAAPSGEPALADVLTAALSGAQDALAKTPDLLDILRQANVVDAGGQGIVHLLEGLSRFATGEAASPRLAEAAVAEPLGSRMAFLDDVAPAHEGEYGYCVNFVVLADGPLDYDAARATLGSFGDSVEVIGNDEVLRVHVHTENPGPILGHAVSLGKLDRIQIENMELQTQHLAQERATAVAAQNAGAETLPPEIEIDPAHVAVLTVAPGPGLAAALQSMGAARVISGGQSMNPSTAELVAGLASIPADQIVILPNNANIVLAAHQAAKLSGKQVAVVPSRSVPQGLAALAALSPDAALDANVRRMTRVLDQVRTVEVTRAVRDAVIDTLAVRQGQAIAFLDERLVATGPDLISVATEALAQADLDAAELVTIFTGEGASVREAEALRASVAAIAPEAAVEIHDGGQPHYPFVIAIE